MPHPVIMPTGTTNDTVVAQPSGDTGARDRVKTRHVAGAVDRRHDLDALRAFAMLLGIGLHAALSFFPLPWPVQDTRQSPLLGLFVAAVHGFRMPLFFLISGYFTMMLYRKRGMQAMLRQRALRILLPCMLGLVTIVPLVYLVSGWAMRSAAKSRGGDVQSVVGAGRADGGRAASVPPNRRETIDSPDPELGITPLGWAALKGELDVVTRLLESGADVNRANRDGSTPLHCAAFLGRHEVVAVLIAHGADVNARNHAGEHPLRTTYADGRTTQFIVGLLGLPQPDGAALESGRGTVRDLLVSLSDPLPDPGVVPNGEPASSTPTGVLARYQSFVSGDFFRLRIGGRSFHLIGTGIFGHLWFLWFLCWIVTLFWLTVSLGSLLGSRLGWRRGTRLPVLSANRFWWLIPLTLVPQWFMGLAVPTFGPDTSMGVIPLPHVLLYYAVFFGFGALYFDADDTRGLVGLRWWLLLPFGLLVALPLGLVGMGYRPLGAPAQVLYAWTMSWGLMGLFRVLLKNENRSIRYLSDASYWLYLAHLPLIIGAQAMVRNWPWPAMLKFLIVSCLTTAILLIIYDRFVRYSWIGLVLNGRRRRDPSGISTASAT
jgi:peptidoglycan/LPS O-acetylase OafA/YrhL